MYLGDQVIFSPKDAFGMPDGPEFKGKLVKIKERGPFSDHPERNHQVRLNVPFYGQGIFEIWCDPNDLRVDNE